MNPRLLEHLLRNWPLTIIVIGLSLYILITLIKGVFYTNQGKIIKASEPARYWNWVLTFIVLEISCVAVLAGSFFLASK